MRKFIFLFGLFAMMCLMSCSEKEQLAVISTDLGDIKVKLYNETPQHRDNFVKLVKDGYYDGTLFHRVIEKFMIQGGDPDSKGAAAGARLGQGGPNYKIPAEFNKDLFHKKGALAAARQGDQQNPEKKSSGSQFYIVTGKVYTDAELEQTAKRLKDRVLTEAQKEVYKTEGGVPFLDGGYTVFGEVIEGMEIAEKIGLVQKDRTDRPLDDIKMTIKLVD